MSLEPRDHLVSLPPRLGSDQDPDPVPDTGSSERPEDKTEKISEEKHVSIPSVNEQWRCKILSEDYPAE